MINFKKVKVLCIEPERVRQLITQIESQGLTQNDKKEIERSGKRKHNHENPDY
jgi:hypothetical protein